MKIYQILYETNDELKDDNQILCLVAHDSENKQEIINFLQSVELDKINDDWDIKELDTLSYSGDAPAKLLYVQMHNPL